jgi:multiple sugar transport system permease protein
MSSISAAESPPLPRRARRRPFWHIHHRRQIQLWGVGFVLPTILFFLVFKYGPMVAAFELSFTSYDMVSSPQFIGLENYRGLGTDQVFQESLFNTLVYIAGSTLLIVVVGLSLALAINTGLPRARYCMTVMFLTNLMPIIAVCLVWRFLLHPYGFVNQLLQPFGVDRVDWLTDSSTAMPPSSWSRSGVLRRTSWWCFSPAFSRFRRTTTRQPNSMGRTRCGASGT